MFPSHAASQDGGVEEGLHYATKMNLPQVVSEVLLHGIDLDRTMGNFGTVLGAVAYCGHDDIARLLLDAGDDPDISLDSPGSVLTQAAYRGHESMV